MFIYFNDFANYFDNDVCFKGEGDN